ncbi:acyl-CoA dehydrogenase [Thiohalorhabdus methylotrophus]|uniref:Acyl-CoA dehydrogenase n=1 Tax=Thiohalorhabdus methylotrophus TaxID=3242694 RepID=A0ABV4TWJ7_9GAMM
MTDVTEVRTGSAGPKVAGESGPEGPGLLPAVNTVVADVLRPQTVAIDCAGRYPGDVMQALGKAGAFTPHLASQNPVGEMDLRGSIEAMTAVSAECLSTGFLTWCQDTCAWYVENTDNARLKAAMAGPLARGEVMGGTGLSNPMKYFSGIEPLRLSAVEEPGGFRINGLLPWVSNLGEDHYFGAVFRVEGPEPREVMAIIPCRTEGLTLSQNTEFAALEGTATLACRFDDVFLPRFWVLADPVGPFLQRVQPGFVLLQMGMGLGMVQGCIELMREVEPRLAHVNCYLEDRPDELAEEAEDLQAATAALARDGHRVDPEFMREVLQLRLAGGELALRAAHSAMLHTGASGYQAKSAAQRKLREAYFVAIVTPAIKHLRKEIAERLSARQQEAAA